MGPSERHAAGGDRGRRGKAARGVPAGGGRAEGEPAEESGTVNAREEAAAAARVCAEKRLIAAVVHEGSGSLT
jgi:hypothetical protein